MIKLVLKKWLGTIALFLCTLIIALHPLGMAIANSDDLVIRADRAFREERYVEAAADLEQLIAQPNLDRLYQTQLLSTLGIAYKNIGQYAQSADRHRQAGKQMVELMKNAQSNRDRQRYRRDLGQILLNLGNTQEALGNYDRALKAYQQSLRIAQETRDSIGEGVALNNLGGIYAIQGNDDLALKTLEEALAFSKTQDDPLAQANALTNLAHIQNFRHAYAVAIPQYESALKLAQSANNKPLQSTILSSLALIYEDQKQYPKAIATHEASLTIARSLQDPEIEAQALNNLGHTLHVANRLPEAEKALRRSIQLLDRLRFGLTDTYKVSKLDTQLHTYSLLQQVLVSAKQSEAALEAAEQGRARAFAELLAQRNQQRKKTPAKFAETKFTEINSINLKQIKQIAKDRNATLIEYAIVPDDDFKFRGKQRAEASRLLIWVVQPTGKITLREVNLLAQQKTRGSLNLMISVARCLETSCPSLAEKLNLPIEDFPENTPEALTYPALPELYQTLIAPIADLLPQNPNDRIIIIPQEELFLVPFAALPDAKGQYFIDRHTIAYAPSIQVLQLLAPAIVPPTQPAPATLRSARPVIVGNPSPMPEQLSALPFSQSEAEKIAQLFSTQPILTTQATRQAIYPKLNEATHIHLATHGLLSYGQVEAIDTPGAIALAPSQTDNGLLTNPDILSLDLQAELVVLSACDTGRGTLTGDGVLGLSRSWLAAGAKNVVVSLWAVNDQATETLMEQFYRSLQMNSDSAIALRKAMLTTRKIHPGPKFWSAFTVVGP